MTDDKDIVKAVKVNPQKGFRLLMAKYREPLYWHIRRIVVSHDDAEDASQETFVRIYRSMGHFSESNAFRFRAWIFRIATNEALRLLGGGRARKQCHSTTKLLRCLRFRLMSGWTAVTPSR